MERSKNKTVTVIHVLYIFVAGIVGTVICGIDGRLLLGLFAGFATAEVNYYLLSIIVEKLLGRVNILAIQLFLFRYLFYLIAAYLCMKSGDTTIIMYGIGIIGLSLAIFITYGIGGMKDQ